MNIHEYQAKELMSSYGIKIPAGRLALSPEEARNSARSIGGNFWAVKAQVHAGGRGKAGGVKLAKTAEEVFEQSKNILGMRMINNQTGPAGKLVKKILVTQAPHIKKEYYLGMLLDRSVQKVVIIGSAAGGMEIERVAHEAPEKIIKIHLEPSPGFLPHHGRELANRLNLPSNLTQQTVQLIAALYRLFVEKDCSLAEINPLIETEEGEIMALDAKLSFDDNALFRHPDILAMRDTDEENPNEVEASRYELSYIALDGNIGCMVNGAGLAMATMDIIKLHGGEPANFLDVGGGATVEKVTAAFKIILSDPRVKAILVNIFGGIMRCDVIAEGIISAARELSLNVPLVVRLNGTNMEQGNQLLKNSSLKIISANTMEQAAEYVTKQIQ